MFGPYQLQILIPKTGNIQTLLTNVARSTYIVITRIFGQNCVHNGVYIPIHSVVHKKDEFLCVQSNIFFGGLSHTVGNQIYFLFNHKCVCQKCQRSNGCFRWMSFGLEMILTAIKAMERAGMDLGAIAKISGHKKIETIVQNYSLSLEVSLTSTLLENSY